jgi:hypothetical protein
MTTERKSMYEIKRDIRDLAYDLEKVLSALGVLEKQGLSSASLHESAMLNMKEQVKLVESLRAPVITFTEVKVEVKD